MSEVGAPTPTGNPGSATDRELILHTLVPLELTSTQKELSHSDLFPEIYEHFL